MGHLVWSFIIGDGEGFTTTRKTAKFDKKNKKTQAKLAYTSTERAQSTRVECA